MFRAAAHTGVEAGRIIGVGKVAAANPLDADQEIGADTGSAHSAGGQIRGDAAGRIRVACKIDALAAEQDVVAGAAVKRVITVVAGQDVIAVAAEQRVVAVTAEENVVAGAAGEHVVAVEPDDNVGAGCAVEGVVTVCADNDGHGFPLRYEWRIQINGAQYSCERKKVVGRVIFLPRNPVFHRTL
jgi:hypothetical protein